MDRRNAASGVTNPPETKTADLPTAAHVNSPEYLMRLSSLNRGSDVALAPPIWEWHEDSYQQHVENERIWIELDMRRLERNHTQHPEIPNDPRIQAYATVVVGGKAVVTVDNQGVIGTDNDALGRKLRNVGPDLVNGTNGPDLAKALAMEIAKLLGGRVEVADTAMRQSDFARLSKQLEPWLDYDQVLADPRYQDLLDRRSELVETEKKRAEYLSQKT
jgi:hypothetical protein